jgi:hypothetical protein
LGLVAVALALAVAQLGLFPWERNVLLGSLSEGARVAATYGRGVGDGERAAGTLVRQAVGGRLAAAVRVAGREEGDLVVFLALLVPLVYAMVVMADVQRAMLATSGAAREVGRVYVTAASREEAGVRAKRAYAEVLASYGLRPGRSGDRLALSAACPGRGSAACAGGFGPGAEVRVVVTVRVPVARLPFLGALAGPVVVVGATHRTRADRFRGLR